MHKLDRPSDEPTALAHARKHYANNWERVMPEDRQSIREKLIPMQNGCCAYCERKVNGNGHIEHFLKKGRDARRTFIWSNLFYSCSTSTTCGTHKDKSVNYPKDESLLINPSEENPEAFIHFSPDGEIDAVQVSAPHDQKRAQKTISVFNLNEPELVRARLNRLKMFEFLKNYSEQERDAYLDQRLADGEPFITCLYHYFGKRVS